VTSRNDGNLDEINRMQLFLDVLLEQSERYKLDSELIIVEWNPPPERPFLGEVLKSPNKLGSCAVRIIQVPLDVHRRFENSESIPLFQMIAKNAGIRRARGRFILATNIDILYSDHLMKFLASKRLKENRMYRIDRYDVPSNIPFHLSQNALMDWCQWNVFRLYRYREIVDINNGDIPPRSKQARRFGFVKRIYDRRGHYYPHLHTNACGDFTLLSTKYWQEVRAYPEFPMRAMKLDGLLCYAAHYAGAREFILNDPARIYHIDHTARGDGAAAALSERDSVQNKNLQISVEQYRAWVHEMVNKGAPIIFNTSDWGLAGVQLEETIIV